MGLLDKILSKVGASDKYKNSTLVFRQPRMDG